MGEECFFCPTDSFTKVNFVTISCRVLEFLLQQQECVLRGCGVRT